MDIIMLRTCLYLTKYYDMSTTEQALCVICCFVLDRPCVRLRLEEKSAKKLKPGQDNVLVVQALAYTVTGREGKLKQFHSFSSPILNSPLLWVLLLPPGRDFPTPTASAQLSFFYNLIQLNKLTIIR